MAASLRHRSLDQVDVLLVMWLVVTLAHLCTAGALCRFASTSANQGPCIFPCRCTAGCNTTTGECINGGQCEDGHPSGYRWKGTACQTGNVAYSKTATQSGASVSSVRYIAGAAVDGNTDSNMSHHHCAHPSATPGANAWWTVDLTEQYRLDRVIIYNRGDCCERRLDTFTLGVGNSSDLDSHAQCARHDGRVAKSGTVETSCEAVTRYLSFRRNGGYEPRWSGLCEVVVIGHLYITCQYCPTTSACNDVIGCDACAPGKQQPDCSQDCDQGKYGINCQENCGQCKVKSDCVITNGTCTGGCKTWYTSDVCKTRIAIPYFKSSDKPEVDDVTDSSVAVSWSEAQGIPAGLGARYYYYIIWLQANGETEKNIARVSLTGKVRIATQVTGLVFNTNYSTRVEPYRRHNGEEEEGTSTGRTRFKTSCIAPGPPVIEKVLTLTPSGSTEAGVVVLWKSSKESGCDKIVSFRMCYKRHTMKSDPWSCKQGQGGTEVQHATAYVTYEVYEIKVTATNNENFSSTSETVLANIRAPPKHTSTANDTASGTPSLATSAWIGIAIGTLVLGMTLMAIILLGIHRMRREKPNTGKQQQETELESVENRGDVIEDASGYVQTQATPVQRDNVYDVIQN